MNKSYRIAHFIETAVLGGAEKLLFDICLHLKEQNHTPILLHFGHADFEKLCLEYNIEQYIIPGHAYFKSTAKLWRFAYLFSKFLGKHKVDLLHSHLFGPITGAAAGAFLNRTPHIGTLHDIYMIENKPSRIRLLQLAAFLNTKLVTVSKSMEQFYRKSAYFSNRSIRTIYNGIQADEKFNITELNKLRKEFNLDGKIVIANVGRLVPLKRHDILLQAIQTIPENFKLLIIGEGPLLEDLQRQVNTLHLNDKVLLTGHRRDINKLLAISDIFVQCSDTEGLSMSIMEAMAAELPCVVTDVGGNHELIQHDQNGYLCKASDSHDLANNLSNLINDKETRMAMGKASLEHCKIKFSHTSTMQNYLNLYNNILSKE